MDQRHALEYVVGFSEVFHYAAFRTLEAQIQHSSKRGPQSARTTKLDFRKLNSFLVEKIGFDRDVRLAVSLFWDHRKGDR